MKTAWGRNVVAKQDRSPRSLAVPSPIFKPAHENHTYSLISDCLSGRPLDVWYFTANFHLPGFVKCGLSWYGRYGEPDIVTSKKLPDLITIGAFHSNVTRGESFNAGVVFRNPLPNLIRLYCLNPLLALLITTELVSLFPTPGDVCWLGACPEGRVRSSRFVGVSLLSR